MLCAMLTCVFIRLHTQGTRWQFAAIVLLALLASLGTILAITEAAHRLAEAVSRTTKQRPLRG